MLFEPLFAHATSQPTEPAVIDDSGKYAWPQLAAMAAGLGMYLSAQTKQPHVGLLLPAGAGFVASFYGTLLAGKSVVPINFLLGEREIAHVIADSGIDTVVTIPLLAARLKDAPLNIVDLTQLPKTPPAIAPKFPSPGSNDLAVIMYTSGTSGLPKGVMLTYGNLQSDVEAAISHAQLTGRHKFLGIIPLFHSTGMLATMIAPVQLGSQMVFIARFSPVGTIKAIREHQVSVIAAVPSMYAAMTRLKEAGPNDVQSLYAAISGGEPLPTLVREAWLKKYEKPIYEGYGLTETIGPVTFNTPQAHRPGSVGTPIPGVSVRITDDDGKPLPQGQTGEIWLKGPMIMEGYYNLPNETAAAKTGDGFFKTGDLGHIDAEGYLHVTGRKKELIIVAGEKASPREIEEVLMRHPAVAEAAVLGKKDPSRGEVVVAFITAKEGSKPAENELRDFCRDQGLVQWKVPRQISIVNDLPRSPTGKVLKRVLAEQLAKSE
jgi:long-chain acyl-CoA synthetase